MTKTASYRSFIMDMSDERTKVTTDENAICERCGRFGAFEIADRKLCGDCYHQAGSCCPEFSGEDSSEPGKDNVRALHHVLTSVSGRVERMSASHAVDPAYSFKGQE